jgi:hypothetical protein
VPDDRYARTSAAIVLSAFLPSPGHVPAHVEHAAAAHRLKPINELGVGQRVVGVPGAPLDLDAEVGQSILHARHYPPAAGEAAPVTGYQTSKHPPFGPLATSVAAVSRLPRPPARDLASLLSDPAMSKTAPPTDKMASTTVRISGTNGRSYSW